MGKDFRFIGKETPRQAAREFVTGRAKYVADLKRPHMLYGRVLRSPHAHANIRNIDTAAAENLPGVRAVLTYKNSPDWYLGVPLPHSRILDNKVRYAGDAVALVAAATQDIAEEALDMIRVDYDPLPAVFDTEEAMRPGAPQVFSQFPGNVVPEDLVTQRLGHLLHMDIGDIEQGFREADVIAEGSARVESGQNPLPAEAPGVIAEWESDDRLTEWGSFSSLGIAQSRAQAAMKLPPGGLRLIAAYVGGSFGSKHITAVSHIMFYAAALARVTGHPVAIFYTKNEHFTSYQVRMGSRTSYRIGMKKDGAVTAVAGDWLANCGAYSCAQGPMVSVGLIALPFLTNCPNIRVSGKTVVTNTIPSGSFRGFGYLENSALLSSVLFRAMEKAEIDPVEFFKKNRLKPGDRFFHPYFNTGFETSAGPDIAPAIEKASVVFGWKEKWKGWGRPTSVTGALRVGVGVGLAGQSDNGEQPSSANVQLNSNGSATVYCCATEFGTGTRDMVRKMAAEALDMPLESIFTTPADTLVNPWDVGSTGSRSTYCMGAAIVAAVADAKKKLFKQAAVKLDIDPGRLETRDGFVYVKDRPQTRLPWIAILGYHGGVTGEGHFPGRFNITTYQCHFVEVEVDVETGLARVLKLVSATDCGQIVNPLALQGQLQGFDPGIGLALRERGVRDSRSGRLLNPNMIDYKTCTFLELPDHRFVITETPPAADPPCPFGAFGAGEPSPTPATPAITMALYNATGRWFTEYPVTPDSILRAAVPLSLNGRGSG